MKKKKQKQYTYHLQPRNKIHSASSSIHVISIIQRQIHVKSMISKLHFSGFVGSLERQIKILSKSPHLWHDQAYQKLIKQG